MGVKKLPVRLQEEAGSPAETAYLSYKTPELARWLLVSSEPIACLAPGALGDGKSMRRKKERDVRAWKSKCYECRKPHTMQPSLQKRKLQEADRGLPAWLTLIPNERERHYF